MSVNIQSESHALTLQATNHTWTLWAFGDVRKNIYQRKLLQHCRSVPHH